MIGEAQTQSSHSLTPTPHTPPRSKHIHISHTAPLPLITRTTLISSATLALDKIPESRSIHILTLRTHHNHTSPAPTPSPLQSLSIPTCTDTRITVPATTASTQGTQTTSQTVKGRQHDYRPKRAHIPAVNVREIQHNAGDCVECRLIYKRNQK